MVGVCSLTYGRFGVALRVRGSKVVHRCPIDVVRVFERHNMVHISGFYKVLLVFDEVLILGEVVIDGVGFVDLIHLLCSHSLGGMLGAFPDIWPCMGLKIPISGFFGFLSLAKT